MSEETKFNQARFNVGSQGEITDNKEKLLTDLNGLIVAQMEAHPIGTPEFEQSLQRSLESWSIIDLDYLAMNSDRVSYGEEIKPIVKKVLETKKALERENKLRKEIASTAISEEEAITQSADLQKLKAAIRQDRGLPEQGPKNRDSISH